MTADWLGIPKGTILIARAEAFLCRILEGEHKGKEIGKVKYKVLKVLPETAEISRVGS
jgi:hypothetical protein